MSILSRVNRTIAAAVLLSTVAVHASAQPRVCIGGDLDRLSAAQKNSCRASADQVRVDVERFHAPADWHFFVVCTEEDWTTYAAMSDRGTEVAASYVDTDLKKHTTFFRGATLSNSEPERFHRLIAHEAARGLLQSVDENVIARQLSVWMPAGGEGVVTLTASR